MVPPFEARQYSDSQVKKAGEKLKHPENLAPQERAAAIQVLVNYRLLHYAPLNTFQATLRKRLKALGCSKAIVAQRIKRLPTILEKLQRFPSMQLNRMQDIGGIRTIAANMAELDKIYASYAANRGRMRHQVVRMDDYVARPKESGYRGRHIVFRYSHKLPDYNGLQVEMQFRTRLQHVWATAVETFEAFMGEQFKSSKGDTRWLEFFALVSSAYALQEKQPVLARHSALSPAQLLGNIRKMEHELCVLKKIQGFSSVSKLLPNITKVQDSYAVLLLDTHERAAQVRLFPVSQYMEAYDCYSREEQRSEGDSRRQVVLVKTDSLLRLQKAYPNYFADLKEFRQHLLRIIAPS